MKTLPHLYRWIFNVPVYGTCRELEFLYRRFERSGVVEVKLDFGWSSVNRLGWHLFKPKITPLMTTPLLNGNFYGYDPKWRDSIGERAFNEAIAIERQKALQKRLKGIMK